MLEQSRLPHSSDAASGLHSKRAVDSVQSFTDLPDLLLVERTRGRDTRAFETLMRRYNRRLYRIARSILSNDDMAEEAVRAAYIRAFANLDRYEPAGKFGAWLARLAFNEALTLRRHSPGAAPSAVAPPAAEAAPAGEGSDAVATRQQLEDAIDALPEVFRTVLVLRVVEDLSGVEVAVCLGLNETTVRTRLYRAQQRLKVDVARRLRAEPFNIFDLSTERCDRIVAQVFSKVHAVSPVVSDAR
ncbi:MAG TPA: sigma-70 family RNA polymerase sigma factor [Steroidobacteraceae bacterium]|nr:sigma-70 family RNA polymerase sigma factor [Steroidobacteraceae bacterium]